MPRKHFILVVPFILLLMLVQCNLIQKKRLDTKELKNIVEKVENSNGITKTAMKKDTINWVGMWKGEGKREVFIKNLINEYNFSHPDVYINFKFREDIPEFTTIKSDIQDMADALFTAHMIEQNRYDWDIVLMLSSSMYQYVGDELGMPDWGHEYLVDFKDVPGYLETENPDIISNHAFTDPYDGIFTGPFIEGAYFVMYCNQDLAEKIGFEIKQFDMTVDDLVNSVKKITDYNQSNGTNIAPFYENGDWLTMSILFEHLFRSAIGYSLDYQAPETFSKKHQMALRECLEVYETLGQYKPVIDSQPQNTWAGSRDLVLKDKAVFYINGTWMYNMWEKIDSSKVNKMIPCEFPVLKKMNFYNGEYKSNYTVLSHSPKKEQAINALMLLASEDAATDWVRMAKSPTGVKMDFEQFGAGGDPIESFVIQMIQKYGRNIGNAPPPIFGTKHLDVRIDGQGLLAILRGKMTAEDMMNQYLAMNLQ